MNFRDILYNLKGNSNTRYNFEQGNANYREPVLISIKASQLQFNHMYSSFYLLYPLNLLLPSFQTVPSLQAFTCPIFPSKELTPSEPTTILPEVCMEISTERQAEVKLEEPARKGKTRAPRQATSRFRYPKKNVESNVVNQCYSFLTTRSKSSRLVSKILGSQEKTNLFYEIMKQGRKKQTKYMGRSVLQNLQQLEDDHPVYILHKKLRCKAALKLTQLRQILRILINYFLKNLIVPAILTSSKMDRSTVTQHLSRVREILAYLNENPMVL